MSHHPAHIFESYTAAPNAPLTPGKHYVVTVEATANGEAKLQYLELEPLHMFYVDEDGVLICTNMPPGLIL